VAKIRGFCRRVKLWWSSWALWLKEGDKCTKFFYRVANLKRMNNSIEQLVDNGTVCSGQLGIREHIVQFYDSLFTKQFSDKAS
jgi:hypothetical protein